MRYKAVFWDWNGTLIDDVGNALSCVNDMLTRKGKNTITLKQYYDYVETPIIGFYKHILPEDELDFKEISENYHKDYIRHLPETKLANGAKELLSLLKEKNIKQYIVSANNKAEVLRLLDDYKLAGYFDGIVASDNNNADSKAEKAKELFLSLNLNRNEILFVGDTLHDYEVANELSADCVLVSYGHQGRRLLSGCGGFVADSLSQVKDIIFDERSVDLHCHSNCSDGSLSPSELVKYAKEKGLSAIALTDHDTVDGLEEAEKEADENKTELIPGIEFSVSSDTEIHIIGLFIDRNNEKLLKTLEKIKENRKDRILDICEKLRNIGIDISFREVLEASGGKFAGRAYVAKVLLNKGYVSSVNEAFEKYIGPGKPAYSDKKDLTAREAIETINAAGGKAFFAHLNQTGYSTEKLLETLKEFKGYGLYGIEGYYCQYTDKQISDYRKIAAKCGLAFSGGSDFHGKLKPGLEIGTGYGNLDIPYFTLKNIKSDI